MTMFPDVDWTAFIEWEKKNNELLRREPLTSNDRYALDESVKLHRGLPRDQRWLRKFIAHGLAEENTIPSISYRDRVFPLTLRGLKAILTYANSLDPFYNINITSRKWLDHPLTIHNRALTDAIEFRIVPADAAMVREYSSGAIKEWAYHNNVCVIARRGSDPSFWIDADDVPLFRLRWEGLPAA